MDVSEPEIMIVQDHEEDISAAISVTTLLVTTEQQDSVKQGVIRQSV